MMFKWLCMRSSREHWVQSSEWQFSQRHVQRNCIRTSLAIVVQRDAKQAMQDINVTRNALLGVTHGVAPRKFLIYSDFIRSLDAEPRKLNTFLVLCQQVVPREQEAARPWNGRRSIRSPPRGPNSRRMPLRSTLPHPSTASTSWRRSCGTSTCAL